MGRSTLQWIGYPEVNSWQYLDPELSALALISVTSVYRPRVLRALVSVAISVFGHCPGVYDWVGGSAVRHASAEGKRFLTAALSDVDSVYSAVCSDVFAEPCVTVIVPGTVCCVWLERLFVNVRSSQFESLWRRNN